MGQYISKDALVAEINRRIKNLYPKVGQGMVVTKILKDHYEDLLSFIDTLEVKEVDLEKEIDLAEDKYYGFHSLSRADIIDVAKHFFELGLKAQKGE